MATTILRRPGEPINLFAATPDVTANRPYDYDEAIRRRLGTVRDTGEQQNIFESNHAAQRLAARQQAMSRQLQSMQGVIGSGSKPVAANGKWTNLVNKAPWFGFGAKYKTGGEHKGLDFAVPSGTQVFAPAAGKVLSYEFQPRGFGNNLRVQFDNGTYGILGHLASAALKAGDVFTAGQLLALSGNTGKSTGDHLHFETRTDLYEPSSAFDPSYLFGW